MGRHLPAWWVWVAAAGFALVCHLLLILQGQA